ncbi:MAG: fatty acid desaturase [Anaerolineae bacterium]|jgi:omega-6 fatty acid desaturase (delta-12 desaturase)|nr:fatty acid desaturase [Anaerolineae bacterium]
MGVRADETAAGSLQPDLVRTLAAYGQADRRRATWQIVTSVGPYLALWAMMIAAMRTGLPYIVTLALAVVAAGFVIRTFIIFHDCCHGSFFSSKLANQVIGTITGILTYTPYEPWRLAHAKHHVTAGNLDRRGAGDVWTMTVAEYLAAPWWKRFVYRGFRHPLVMFGLGPLFAFVLSQRFARKGAGRREHISTIGTNLGLLAILAIAWVTIGLRAYLLIQAPVILIAAMFGIWLFYVQHQFQGVYWARDGSWDRVRAAVEGSSFYKLPKVLQWFSGNIGLHHIHHLRATIPNYNLQAAYDAIPALQMVKPLTLAGSLKCLGLALYDEAQGRLVRFGAIKSALKGTVRTSART